MRKLSAFFLSLLTVVGGHILNRRADKALLFFSLLLVVALLNLFSFPLLALFGGVHAMTGLSSYWQLLPISIAASMGLVVLSSAIVSYLDATGRLKSLHPCYSWRRFGFADCLSRGRLYGPLRFHQSATQRTDQ
jgi:hypothetical protein